MDSYSFETLLSLNVTVSVLWTILSLFYQTPPTSAPLKKAEHKPSRTPVPGSFYPVVAAATLGWFSINGGKLGITLVMTGLEFSADDISLTVGVASLVALAMPLFLGWFSDYSGRKPLLLGLSFLGLAGLFLISRGQKLSEFCVASSLLSLYSCLSGLSNALVTALVPKESLGFGLSLINGTSFIAGIFNSALFGLTLNNLGPKTPFLLGMLLRLAAALLLAGLKENKPGVSFLK